MIMISGDHQKAAQAIAGAPAEALDVRPLQSYA